jgi:nickel/cobalt exporter
VNQNLVKEILYYQHISPVMMALVLAVAFVLGAIHALAPGHGKSLMAAYLIGAKGKIRDALTLGIIITISHVFSVIIIGLVALQITDFFKTERISLWLGLVSGVLIVAIGLWLFFSRFRALRRTKAKSEAAETANFQPRDLELETVLPGAAQSQMAFHEHESYTMPGHSHTPVALEEEAHGHSHDHHHRNYNPELSIWSNIALGISGGIVPCPKAILILLLAISLQRIGLGIVIVSVFSLGLAAVLIAIGIIMVKASHLLKGKFEDRRIQALPVLGALIIVGLGLFLSVRTLMVM